MENLFRLMLVRPAVAQDPENPSIDLTQESDYQNSLRDAIPGARLVVLEGGGHQQPPPAMWDLTVEELAAHTA